MGNNLMVREFTPADWPMISMWLDAHDQTHRVLLEFLPPVGVIVSQGEEPLAALWCHLSVGCGIAFVESAISKPGLSLSGAKEAFRAALGAIEAICRTHDYKILMTHTLPAPARFLSKECGWSESGAKVQLMKVLL